ncbi:MAG: NAD(P)-dependent alcohol dehydrogenase [Actinomycetota bacterium]|nr:NAD(P)-dependent alcohol dehydrogenase [Actinomycetota bacterium]
MKAIFHDRYGSAEVLEFRDLPLPPLGDDEVLVRVHAAGVNRGDGLAVEGIPYAARLTYGLTRPKHNIPGTDVAGRVEAVGKDVTALESGDDILGWTTGAFAEYTSTAASMLVRKPAHLTFEQAAATPTTGVAALQALRDVGRIEAGHRVLVVGASGGVGSFAVQIAKAFGAEVTGVASTRNIDLVRSTGADHVIDYTRDDFTRHVYRYDLILDMVGKETLSSSRRALRANGTYVVVGGGNPRSITGMGRFAKAMLLSPFVSERLRPLFSKQNHQDLEALRELLDTGRVLPVIDAVYDLRDTPEALHYVQAGHARGKAVITI